MSAEFDKGLSEGYRRGIKDAFHRINGMCHDRRGRTDKEMLSYIVRSFVEWHNVLQQDDATAVPISSRPTVADQASAPIYQIAFSDEDGWCDTAKKFYDSHPMHMRRIVYAHPAPQAVTRDDALEEAAQACEGFWPGDASDCAAAIRALKDKS